ETAGNPIVHGRFDSRSDAPTLTVYNHLDVQPASRDTEPWDSDPFVFTKDGDRYLGRGTTDDKGPALTALWGIRAARDAGVPLNLRVLWELEEVRNSGFSVKKFKSDHLFKSIRTEDPLEVMKRIWAMPTMEVHGVIGGYSGPGIKTIIPPYAAVKMSCRLVPKQDPKKILRLMCTFVKAHNSDVEFIE